MMSILQRFFVHALPSTTPHLVLFIERTMSGLKWWYADDRGRLQAADADALTVCRGRECVVEECTRKAEFFASMREAHEAAERGVDQVGMCEHVIRGGAPAATVELPIGFPDASKPVMMTLCAVCNDRIGTGHKVPVGHPEPGADEPSQIARYARFQSWLLKEFPGQVVSGADFYQQTQALLLDLREQKRRTEVPVGESIQSQVDRLAGFILEEVDGEPSQNEGAVDTAIRLIRDQQAQLAHAARERRATLESYQTLEIIVRNFGYFLDQYFPVKASLAGETQERIDSEPFDRAIGLLKELRSRRAEQGELTGHSTDDPMSRLRFWFDANDPKWESPLSNYVIKRMERLKRYEQEETAEPRF